MTSSSVMTSTSLPTSAAVLDFICLFTHDLKRKQKRWQDGVLKYHTFNKRVMVYDDRGHFIGDAHWQEDGDLEPGEEFELDRGAAIVQVSDCTGQREQDLTELLDKRAKDVERRRANATTRTAGSTARTAQTPRNESSHFQLRHRPLTDIVGGSSRIGRAVISPHSPYKARRMAASPDQQQESPSENPRASKRRRREESPPSKLGHARSLFGATLSLTPYTPLASQARSQALRDRTNMASKTPSTSARARHPGTHDICIGDSKSPSPSSDTEKVERTAMDTATRPAGPRRILVQRASLRELLGGNNQNPNLDTRPNESKQLNHQRPEKSPRPLSTLRVNKERPTPIQEHVQIKDNEEAFLNWLGSNEGGFSGCEISAPSSGSCSSPPKDAEVSMSAVLSKDNENPTRKQHLRNERNHARDVGQSSKPCLSLTKDMKISIPAPEVIDADEDDGSTSRLKKATDRAEPGKPKSPTKDQGSNATGVLRVNPVSKVKLDPKSHSEVHDASRSSKEPRTKLRIRPRQRRGLLVISELKDRCRPTRDRVRFVKERSREGQGASELDSHLVSSTEVADCVHSGVLHRNLSGSGAKRRLSASSITSQVSISDSDDKPGEPSHPVPVTQIGKGLEASGQNAQDEGAQDIDADAGVSIAEEDILTPLPRLRSDPTRHSRQRAARPMLSDDEEGSTNTDSEPQAYEGTGNLSTTDPDLEPDPKPTSGPRITRMARKNVKSKEIIGFITPTDDFHPTGFTTMSIGHFGHTEVEKKGKDNVTHKSHVDGPQDPPIQSTTSNKSVAQSDETQRGVSDKSQARQPSRLTNPATRGKKAARKQDAAGLPPQTMVQLDPAIPSRIAPVAQAKRTPSGNNGARPSLPGFTRANGGAWSRHAEDLLGMTRPSRAASRR
ncbi:hypothetical protein ACJZ2D_009591 [Fusarium nematophilum]